MKEGRKEGEEQLMRADLEGMNDQLQHIQSDELVQKEESRQPEPGEDGLRS